MNGRETLSEFPFVHPDISAVLNCPPSTNDDAARFVNPETLEIVWEARSDPSGGTIPVSTQLLVDLAHTCDHVLYQHPLAFENKSMQSLSEMGETSDSIVAATLLALNGLESAIRRSAGYAAGRAPLLKSMVKELSNRTIASILMTLLLPTPGLNLRNLLWHGFCGPTLPRSWLALVLILTNTLEKSYADETTQHDQQFVNDILALHPAMATLFEDQKNVTDSESIKGWLPESHRGLLTLAFSWRYSKPACSIAVLAIILEHGLRLDWCRVNESPQDAIARPGAYYVTLDGHGQRLQHDLILNPYIGGDQRENKLISHLGGATVALLTDLFASSCGGPNIRATLAHGLWDSQLERELASDEHDHSMLVGMVGLVIVAMEGAALSPRSSLRKYRPVYSYRACALRNLEDVITQLAKLSSLQTSRLTTVTMLDNCLIGTLKDINFEELTGQVLDKCRITVGEWQAEHVFQEYQLNVVLATRKASCTLLGDVATAALSYASSVERALSELEGEDDLNHRRWHSLQRICAMADIVTTVYRFAAFVGLVSLHQAMHHENDTDDEERLPSKAVLKAVERSRMCVSTVDTFLVSNADRCIKAALDYAKGKTEKAVLQFGQRETQWDGG
jgi:hypothetical protein